MRRIDKAIILIHEIERQLRTVYDDPTLCRQYAWWIIEEITKQQKEDLLADNLVQLSEQDEKKLDQWLNKLINEKIPLQYLIGTVPFNDIEILVEPPVLIPRPETEEWTLRLIKQLKKLTPKELVILDFGTGSGCIALALANALPHARVYATDIVDNALYLAQKNALHNGITNVSFIKSNLFEAIPKNLHFDLIVSNPPYIAPDEWEQLDKSVTHWEDKKALVANQKGLSIIAAIVTQACCFLKTNNEFEEKNMPNVVVEIGYRQAEAGIHLMEQAGFIDIHVEKDLEGKDRIISGRVEPCGPCHPIAIAS